VLAIWVEYNVAPPAPWVRAAEHLFGACAAGARICADSVTPRVRLRGSVRFSGKVAVICSQ
jgi:hypothetical protein